MKPSPLKAVWNPRGGGSPHPGPESGGEERSQGWRYRFVSIAGDN